MGATCAIVVGVGASGVRRLVGPTAWCALEVVAASARAGHGDDRATVNTSVRSVAVELGVSKNTAHRALLVLRAKGLVVAAQGRNRGGQFDVGTYSVAVPSEIIDARPSRTASALPSVPPSNAGRRRQVSDQRQVEQLVLLPAE